MGSDGSVMAMGKSKNQKRPLRSCSVPTVERKLRRIRLIWEKEIAP
jgi:hypothetical protein